MEDHVPAEEIPTLYRGVLETVARLERVGDRRYAYDLRARAVRTYSTRWDEAGRRTLGRLDREGHARLEATRRAGARSRTLPVSETS
jgi:hypothetical protein